MPALIANVNHSQNQQSNSHWIPPESAKMGHLVTQVMWGHRYWILPESAKMGLAGRSQGIAGVREENSLASLDYDNYFGGSAYEN
ncbi:hypothetical protein [Schleiferilactobacillus harbinensis]|uniref:hypothetical protein n=1 Tax=Schleiferilactobacillus harbinensis TaxID=304207 RepID=UPI0011BE16E8|nr:hypothetical protein [Schleiferilactobacillus harbinensis]